MLLTVSVTFIHSIPYFKGLSYRFCFAIFEHFKMWPLFVNVQGYKEGVGFGKMDGFFKIFQLNPYFGIGHPLHINFTILYALCKKGN